MTPYPFTSLSDLSFEFTTDQGVVYKAYFISFGSVFSEFPEFSDSIYNFNLEVFHGDMYDQAMDQKIGETVVDIFRHFFAIRQNVIIYICDTSDNKHIVRKRKFDLWFWKYSDGSILKDDGLAVIEDTEIFNSLLVHKQNIFLDKIVSAFRTLNERAADK